MEKVIAREMITQTLLKQSRVSLKKILIMKKKIFLLAAILAIAICCTKQQEVLQGAELKKENAEFRNSASNFTPFNIPFPKGTTFKIVGNELQFTLPKPYYIVGVDQSGHYYTSASGGAGGITCECTQGSGCDPIKNGNDIGCIMKTGCSKCTKSKANISGIHQDLIDIVIMSPETNLYITDFAQLDQQYILPNAFLGYSKVENILSDIRASQMHLPESELEIVFINVHGYMLPIELKMDGDNVSIKATGNKISCECNVAGSCPKEKHWSGVVWCNSDKCTMHTAIINSNGVEKILSSNRGLISIK